ncbi:MAG: PKD domain-containing protein [Dysgonomonas sp.]
MNTDVTFTDKSDNMPDEWLWTLPGTNVGTSTDQNPTVQYTTEGTFDVKLEVKNGKGSAEDQHYGSVRAGIPTHIWNIYQDEYDLMGTIAVGWYGYYGGTNWLGMEALPKGLKNR